MKKVKRNLLTVILAVLCAAACALAAIPVLSTTSTKTAKAAGTDFYDGGDLNADALDAWAASTSGKSYSDLGDLIDDVQSGTTLKASNYSSAITFGGMEWWPVLVEKSGDSAVLTLWHKNSIGNYSFSDGTYSTKATSPASNDYTNSWIRAALNMGQTDLGYYYGGYPNGSGTTCTKYQNNQKSASANCAPTAFTTFKEFVAGGTYADFILPGPTGDNIWLPSTDEAQNGGSWGCTSANWAINGSSYQWTRSPYPSNYSGAYDLGPSGGPTYNNVNYTDGVRPALRLDLSSAASAAVAPNDVEADYTGSALSIADVTDTTTTKWYKSDRVTLTYHTDASCTAANLVSGAGPIDAGDYYIKVALAATLNPDSTYKFKFKPSVDPTGSYTTQRWMPVKFTVNKKVIGVKFTYDSDGLPSVAFDGALATHDTTDPTKTPSLKLKYSSTTGASVADPYTLPTAIGTYKATAEIENEATGNYNYVLDTKTIDSKTFNITARKVDDPVSTTGSNKKTVPYDGNPQTMTLQNITDGDVSYTPGTGVTIDSYDNTTGVLTFSATNAGTYYVNADLADGGAGTVWKTSGGTATKQFTLEIEQATLTPTITGLPTSWAQGTSQTATVTLSGLIGSDTVSIEAYYKKSGGLEIAVAGVGDTFTIPNDLTQGSYTFGVKYTTTTGNYKMSEKTVNFTIDPPDAAFTASDIEWQYSLAGGAATIVPSGKGTATDPYKVSYANANYQFTLTLDSAALAAKGVKASYSGDTSAKNAKSTLYKVTVTIAAKDSSVSYTTSVHDFYFEIEKAKFDLSTVEWDYDSANPLQYSGSPQTVTLKGGTIPTGLTASYVKNPDAINQIAVGTYSLRVTFTASDTTNYIEPVYGDTTTYDGTFDFVCDWEIAKKKINVTWSNHSESDTNGNIVIIPRMTANEDLIDYSFEMMDSSGSYISCGSPVYVDGTEVQYKIKVALKSANTASYELVGTDYKEFSVGKDKYPVQINLNLNGALLDTSVTYYYNGSPYVATAVLVSGYVTTSDFVIKYYDKTDLTTELASAPVNVGDYKVVVELTASAADNNVITGTSEFEFSIAKGTFDTSGLSWQYTHDTVTATWDEVQNKWIDGAGLEVTEFVYDGTAHVFTLVGKSDVESQPGMTSVTLTDDNNTNAGSYTLTVTFTYDTDNYDAPVFAADSIPYVIKKATIDTDDVKWGYIGEDGAEHEITATTVLEYMRDGSAAKDYEFVLINLPAELSGKVSYKLNGAAGNTVANVGTYYVEYTISGLDTDNYETLVMPATLETKKFVDIVERDLGKPTFDGSWTEFNFLDDPRNLLELCGMDPEGLGVYYNATVKFNGDAYAGYDGEQYDGFHAGKYVVVFDVIKLTGETGNNVTFGGTVKTQEVEIDVAKQTITVTGWTGDEESSSAKFDLTGAAAVVGTRIEDEFGTVYTEEDYYSAPAGNTFFAKPYVKEGYEDDIEIAIKPGVAEKIEFSSSFEIDSNTKFIAKPSFENASIEYDGDEHEFVLNGLDGNEDYIYVAEESDDLWQTESGKYSVTIRFVSGVNACWEGSTKENPDRKAITLEFEITKKQILIPEVEDKSYSGDEIDVWTDLEGSYGDFVIMVSGDYFGTDAGKYNFVLKLNTEKYGDNIEWVKSTSDKSTTKSAAKWALASSSVLSSDKKQVTVHWEITKAVITGVWQKDGTLKLTIPGYNGPVDGLIQYTYTDTDGYSVAPEDRVAGQKYNSSAKLNPDYAKNFEFDAATKAATATPNSGAYDPTNGQGTKPSPLDSIKNFMTKTVMYLPVWAWFLIALALLILLIIIIVVACKRRKSKEEKEAIKAAKEEEKQRKLEEKERLEEERRQREEEKRLREEEREEERRRKEEERAEEKARREEEREEEKRRREEEREAEREKQRAEMELAKAKQEAELARIKAEAVAAASMGGMGMATMAMQQPQASAQTQQPVQQSEQQPVQQPVAQQQPVVVQQPAVDNSILSQIQAELAAMRNDQAAMRNDQVAMRNELNSRSASAYSAPQYQQMPMMPQMPMPMQGYNMPYAQPVMNNMGGGADYHSMYMEERARAAEARLAEERIRTAEEKLYHAAEQRAVLAEERFVRGGMYQQPQQLPAPQQVPMQMQMPVQQEQPIDADFLGTAIAAALRSNAQIPAAPVQMLPQQTAQEEHAKPVQAQYPADAIITTTTTVDTSKQKAGQQRAVRDDGRIFDSDGFYDPLD